MVHKLILSKMLRNADDGKSNGEITLFQKISPAYCVLDDLYYILILPKSCAVVGYCFGSNSSDTVDALGDRAMKELGGRLCVHKISFI